MFLKRFWSIFPSKISWNPENFRPTADFFEKSPPLVPDRYLTRGGAFLKNAHTPKKIRAFGAILPPFLLFLGSAYHVFYTKNGCFSLCTSKFSRLRRTFSFYTFLQTFCTCVDSAVATRKFNVIRFQPNSALTIDWCMYRHQIVLCMGRERRSRP